MKSILETLFPPFALRIITGLLVLVLGAYSFIGSLAWGELKKTTEKSDKNEIAVVSISKDVEQINKSLKDLDRKLTKIVERADGVEKADRLERLIRLVERSLQDEPQTLESSPR